MAAIDDLPRLLRQLASDHGAAPALSFHRGRTLVGALDYGELSARVARAAATLHRLGVTVGDRVALAAPNGLEVPVWLLAMWRLGAVAVPLNPHASRAEWHQVLAHAGARGLIAAPALADVAPATELAFVRSIDQECGEDLGQGFGQHFGPPATATPPLADDLRDAPAIILYTSGTTGSPKGVTLSQRNLLANARALAERFRLARTTQLAVMPLYHAHALGFGLLSALVSGGHLVFAERFDPLAWGELVRVHAATFASVTPNLLPLLLQARLRGAAVPSLRGLLVSSAPLPSELARRFEERSGVPLVHGWGLSEYTNFACCTDPFAGDDERRALLWGDEVPSIGAPMPGTEVSVRGDWGELRGEGERGELCVRGPCRMLSYYNDRAATEQACHGDWLRTGDQGFYRMRDGSPRFYITGRIKEIIIRGGEKHSPVALENQLTAELPELAGHLVVLGFAHLLQGEEIGAYVEIDPLPEALQVRLLDAIARFPADGRPKVILHGPEPIPRTHTGKVQRKKLQPLFAAFHDLTGRPRLERAQLASTMR